MEGSDLLIFAIGAGAAGYIGGLTGLGAALIALAFWLHVMPPQVAVPMAALIGVTSHLVTLGFIRHGIRVGRLWPFILGGLIGLPMGLYALSYLNVDFAKAGLGILLVLYCSYGLIVKTPPQIQGGGRRADGVIGFLGGFFGGVASMSGPVPTIWAGLRGWPKDEQRGVFQPFNLVILGIALIGHSFYGRFDVLTGPNILIAMACGAAGAVLGIYTYRHTSDRNFRRLVLILLLIGGLSHLGSVLF
ncbi:MULTISPECIES: sulfite exporter TauE/SafE family protein [unclassified Hwanghaeella]|jgi:uncharacterized membrane protein YfcA|uniref:sulfite exporter TauE/SafE family protein n=1 Tax=unclassified Hwanghaeella TaxID=2605944 RepID=UPI003B6756F4|tara:strand:+ start:93945 stop:94682 length:738 start_codon:yes stop_codon:yes gene_type:complete